MEFIRKAIKVGNSAGVLLPKKLLGAEVKITIIKKPINIKKELIKNIHSFLEDVIAACVIENEPIEILVITRNTKKIIKNKDFKISIVPLKIIERDMKKSDILKAKINNSKPLLNKLFFEKLKL